VRDLAVLFLHLLATVARLAGRGGARSVVAESVLVKHQLLILNRSRKRSPNLRSTDRMVAGLCAIFIRPGRLIRSAMPTYLSADHDPLYRFHQWQANLRILHIQEIKTVPYVPCSHPVVERLIGTLRRERLDRMLFLDCG
jgi:hypothetical protein